MVLVAIGAWQGCLVAGATTTLTALKSYELHGGIGSADISPDEKLVAIERTSEENIGNTGLTRLNAIVELLDFRTDRVVAHTVLKGTDVPRSRTGTFAYANREAPFVRFTADGEFVVANFDDRIRVLRTNDLSEVRSIPINRPPTATRIYHLKKYGAQKVTYVPEIQAFDTSPTGTLLAIFWAGTLVNSKGRLDIYDISSGQRLATWRTPGSLWHPLTAGSDLAWGPTSRRIFVAEANSIPCLTPGSAPDVFGFDVRTGAVETSLTTRLMVGDIAVTPARELLAVDANCVGVFSDHHPKMAVFDLRTGKHVRGVGVKKTGVRYQVSVSRNGQRAVAWTSEVKCKFDWGDMDCDNWSTKPMFTVWHLPNFSVVATSQVLPTGGALKISSTGRYVLVYGKKGFVFEVP